MIVFQILIALTSFVFRLLQCRPMKAYWDHKHNPTAKCISPHAGRINLYFNAAANITTDIIFALLPLFFIWKLWLPLRERVVLSIVMEFGLFASFGAIYRTALAPKYGQSQHFSWNMAELML
jgi:hypothetical protein